ncbi:hypothetical protein PO883_22175 [Massilia sp. DJPM01]|nr:hypothetical protein [Massilia sp. DJPM01]MDM5179903.1 hypothetical protein [Massilia sp. DJPM01]
MRPNRHFFAGEKMIGKLDRVRAHLVVTLVVAVGAPVTGGLGVDET